MVQKYVWADEIQKTKHVRREIRMPEALDDFCKEVAKVHGVSVSAFIVGLIVHASDARSTRRLIIERIPAVRVSEPSTATVPVNVPVPLPSAATRKRWGIKKVL